MSELGQASRDYDSSIVTEGTISLSQGPLIARKADVEKRAKSMQSFLRVLRGRRFLAESACIAGEAGGEEEEATKESLAEVHRRYQTVLLQKMIVERMQDVSRESAYLDSLLSHKARRAPHSVKVKKVEEGLGKIARRSMEVVESYARLEGLEERAWELKRAVTVKLGEVTARTQAVVDAATDPPHDRSLEEGKFKKSIKRKKSQVLFMCCVVSSLIKNKRVDLRQNEDFRKLFQKVNRLQQTIQLEM